jgi:hypothetical protein
MDVMSPRCQFSLKRLLIVLTLACLVLGAWSFYFMLIAPFVTAEYATTGKIVRVRGRFLDVQGSDWETCYVQIQPATEPLSVNSAVLQNRAVQVKRRWPWFYDVDLEIPPIQKPGEYRLVILPMTKAVTAGRGSMVDYAVLGRCQIDGSARLH